MRQMGVLLHMLVEEAAKGLPKSPNFRILGIRKLTIYAVNRKRDGIMQLFVHITNHEENVAPIFKRLIEVGIQGATVVDCQGMLTTLSECNTRDAPPIFGSFASLSILADRTTR
jgi:hypothetical protein